MLYLSLGSNMGDRETLLNAAIEKIDKQIGTVCARSAFVVTAPWGFDSPNEFLNVCVAVDTTMVPWLVLRKCQQIERQLGRKQKSSVEQLPDGSLRPVYHDRVIDIDILVYGEMMRNTPHLTIPHPLLSQRRFVLEPLAQIAYDLKIPGTEMSVGEMLNALDARS